MDTSKLLNDIEQAFDPQQINEQFLNEYIYKLSLFNPELYAKVNNICSLSYLLAVQMRLNKQEIKDIYLYSSLYYIKDSKVIQLKMSSYFKKLEPIKRILTTGISYYNKDFIALVIIVCDTFLELYANRPFNQCIKEMRLNETIPQIFVDNLEKIPIEELERNLY